MKKIIGTFLSLVMIIGTLPGMAVKAETLYSGGEGTKENPYIIRTKADLTAVATNVNNSETSNGTAHTSCYKLANDIDLEKAEWTPIGLSANKGFSGTFDGDGHVVKNFKITQDTNQYVGFFGAVASPTIKNLGIENVQINVTANTKQIQAGVMIGRGGANVENCYVKSSSVNIGGNRYPYIGAFTGSVRKQSEYKNCYAIDCTLNVQSGTSVGGFTANIENYAEHGTGDKFINCYVANVTGAKYSFAHGSHGKQDYNATPTLTNCYTTITETNTGANVFTGVHSATKDAIVAAMTAGGEYVVSADKNNGWPYVDTNNECVWDGTSKSTSLQGDGTEANPYLINTAADLAYLADAINNASTTELTKVTISNKDMYLVGTDKHYKLMADLDMHNESWTPIGSMTRRFDGVFDGNEHTIKNISVTNEKDAEGLFGAIGKNARIKKLGVDGVSLKTKIKTLTGATFERCTGFGGLVGSIMTGGSETSPIIDNCFAKNVLIEPIDKQMGGNYSGGLVGNVVVDSSNTTFYISNSYTYNVTIKNHIDKGAFMGVNAHPSLAGNAVPNIKNCYAGGAITIDNTANSENAKLGKAFAFMYVGGSVAVNGIVNCYTAATTMNEKTSAPADAYTTKIGYNKTATEITTALATDGSSFAADGVINNGFPIFEWEKAAVETDGKAYYVKTLSAKNNSVNLTMVANDASVSANVYVAAYANDGRFISVAEKSASEVVSGGFTTAVPEGTKTIKVFVWTDDMTSVANMQSKTL